MGGFGSGPRGARPILERAVALDVAVFDREGAFTGSGYGSFMWPEIDDLVFEFETSSEGLCVTSPVVVNLAVTLRRTSTGGQYRLWICPQCGVVRKQVFVALGSDTFACRVCLGLTYRRSNLSGTGLRLAAWQRNRASRRLGELDTAAGAVGARCGRRREEDRRTWRQELATAESGLSEHVQAYYRKFHDRLSKSQLWEERVGCFSRHS